MTTRPRLSTLVALGVVTAATLGEQVVITRLFSAALAYHFGFLAISVALLGTGAAALLVYVRPTWFEGPPEPLLARACATFAAALVLSPFILVRLDFSGVNSLNASFAANLLIACLVAAAPPFASGIVVALAIDRYRADIGIVYAFDLVGAGLGALLVVPLLWLGPAPLLLVAIGVFVGVAAVLFSPPRTRERRASLASLGLGAALVVLGVTTHLLYLDPRYELPPGTRNLGEHWTPIARAIGYELPQANDFALLFYDRVYAPVPIPKTEAAPDFRVLKTGPASIGFAVAGPGRTLVIGGGGGRDIYNALSSGQLPVDVVELSEANRRVVDEDLGALSGKPYSRPGVNTVIGDGRSVLAGRSTKYDQIHIGFTDTLSANAAQGFALTENNLYTVEAFEEYFDHLTPHGILNVSRLLKLVGDEALRVTVLTLDALRRRGIADPFRNVVVVLGSDVLGPPTGTVLARLEPFTESEIATIRRLADERANGLLLVPGGPNRAEWADLARSPSVDHFCTHYRLDVCPPTDDRPFFFSMGRLRDLGNQHQGDYHYVASPVAVLLLTLAILTLLSVIGLVLPLRLVRGPTPPATSLAYFGAIGFGFLLLEVVLVQRFVLFLGYPTYALSIVLFTLLVFSGGGSLLSARFANPDRALVLALGYAALLIAVSAFGLRPGLAPAMALPFAARALIAVVVLAPIGILLGMAMPLGLRRFSRNYPHGVAYAWGVNGIASVLASVFGTVVALHLGFTAASLCSAACYLVALVLVALGAAPASSVS